MQIQGESGPGHGCAYGIGHRCILRHNCGCPQTRGDQWHERWSASTHADDVLSQKPLFFNYLPDAIGGFLFPFPEHLVDLRHDSFHNGIDHHLGCFLERAAQLVRHILHSLFGFSSVAYAR